MPSPWNEFIAMELAPVPPVLDANAGACGTIAAMWELGLLAAAGLAGWLVVDALRAREAAVFVARAACQQRGLQFLDDTVRSLRTRLARDDQGRAVLRRTFVFEFSEDGVSRRDGSITMLGAQTESVQLEPFRLV